MKKILTMVIGAALLLSLLSGCAVINKVKGLVGLDKEVETTTEDFELIGYSSFGKGIDLMVTTDFGVDDRTLHLTDDQAELGDMLYKYNSKLILRAAYDEDYNLIDYSVLDLETGEDYGKLDAQGIYEHFDVRARYETEEAVYEGDIQLSDLKEGVLYVYSVDTEAYPFLAAVNDTGKNVAVYGEDSEYGYPETHIYMADHIGDEAMDPDYSSFSEMYFFRWVELTAENLFDVVEEDAVLRLSGCTAGEAIEINFESCVYNDTGAEQTIVTGEGEEYPLAAGAIIGIDWMTVADYTLK